MVFHAEVLPTKIKSCQQISLLTEEKINQNVWCAQPRWSSCTTRTILDLCPKNGKAEFTFVVEKQVLGFLHHVETIDYRDIYEQVRLVFKITTFIQR